MPTCEACQGSSTRTPLSGTRPGVHAVVVAVAVALAIAVTAFVVAWTALPLPPSPLIWTHLLAWTPSPGSVTKTMTVLVPVLVAVARTMWGVATRTWVCCGCGRTAPRALHACLADARPRPPAFHHGDPHCVGRLPGAVVTVEVPVGGHSRRSEPASAPTRRLAWISWSTPSRACCRMTLRSRL